MATLTHEYHSPDNTPALYIAPSNDNGTAIQQTGASLTNANPAHVAIVDSNGDQITSFGAPASPLFATIATSSSGASSLVAAVGGKIIRVLQVILISNGAVNVKFQSHTSPTDLTGLFYLVANTGFSSGYSPVGQFQTTIGEALDINLSGSVAIGGYLTYILI